MLKSKKRSERMGSEVVDLSNDAEKHAGVLEPGVSLPSYQRKLPQCHGN
jgi:hypothetical protein